MESSQNRAITRSIFIACLLTPKFGMDYGEKKESVENVEIFWKKVLGKGFNFF